MHFPPAVASTAPRQRCFDVMRSRREPSARRRAGLYLFVGAFLLGYVFGFARRFHYRRRCREQPVGSGAAAVVPDLTAALAGGLVIFCPLGSVPVSACFSPAWDTKARLLWLMMQQSCSLIQGFADGPGIRRIRAVAFHRSGHFTVVEWTQRMSSAGNLYRPTRPNCNDLSFSSR